MAAPTFGSGGGGGASTAAGDWAEGHAAVSGEWTSASTYGAATSVYHEATDLGVRMRTDKADDGVTDTNGNRVQGLLRTIAAGDFEARFRVSWDRTGVAASAGPSAYEASVVFVDNPGDVDAGSHYSVGIYWGGDTLPNGDINRYENTSGANRFESRSFSNLFSTAIFGTGPVDVFLRRTGTTLAALMCTAGGVPQLMHSWTVSAGAGLVGLRAQHFLAIANDLYMTIHAYEVA